MQKINLVKHHCTCAAASGHAECVKTLFRNGAKVDATGKDGNTALSLAALQGSTECIRILCEHGANIEAVNKNFDRPLHLACVSGHRKCVELLILLNAEINARGFNGSTALAQVVETVNSSVLMLC